MWRPDDHIALTGIGPDQADFLKFLKETLRPQLTKFAA